MRTETFVCDRCKRDRDQVPPAMGADGTDYAWLTIHISGDDGVDLCAECFVAFLAWVDLGEVEATP